MLKETEDVLKQQTKESAINDLIGKFRADELTPVPKSRKQPMSESPKTSWFKRIFG